MLAEQPEQTPAVLAEQAERKPAVRPERRRRGDLVAAASLVLVLVATAATLWWSGPAAGTSSVTAAVAISAPPVATAVPVAFTEVWRAFSAATPVPVAIGPAVVTADGSTVIGHEALTGVERWRYTRDLPLCTVGSGFSAADGGFGRVLAVYQHDEYCSELTTLRSDTGVRAAQRNPDARPGIRVLGSATLVALTGADHLEILRSDLVRTLEFGDVPAPEQPARQPRTGCAFGSFALAADRIGVLERCPGEPADRLTVLSTDGPDGAEEPEEQFSVLLPSAGATLIALSDARTAIVLPGPPRLQILDPTGEQVALIELDVPDTDLAGDPPGRVAAVVANGQQLLWWTGSHTIALDATELTPTWTLPGTLGAGVPYAGALLVPVPDGLLEVDPGSGVDLRTVAVERADRTAPVRLATQGEVLLEQRGVELVALRPTP